MAFDAWNEGCPMTIIAVAIQLWVSQSNAQIVFQMLNTFVSNEFLKRSKLCPSLVIYALRSLIYVRQCLPP